MGTALVIILFVVGIVFIVKGGDWFVDAAVWIAETSGIPKFLIGATVVSFATTLPELLVSVMAALDGKNGMAVGNAVGSVTANIGLIMAISVIFIPVVINRKTFAFKPLLMIASISALILFSLGGELKFIGSVIILCMFAVFITESIVSAKKTIGTESEKKEKSTGREIATGIFKFIAGTAGIIIGARLLVDNGSKIAEMLGVPEAIISVTVIAIGTSLPELVTTITAIVKKQANLSVGNIIGANIIDLTLIMPICAVITGGSLPIAKQSLCLDLPVCALVCAFSVIPALIAGKFRRWQGFALLGTYIVYLIILIIFFI